MEIRGKAWTTGHPEPISTLECIIPEYYTNPLWCIKNVEGRIIERLTKERPAQSPIITYSMSSGEFDFIVKDVKEKALKEGREEAWDLARRIVTCESDAYTGSDFDSVFGSRNATTIFGMPAEEALSKDKECQEEKKTLHVGDEVMYGTTRAYITNLDVGTSGEKPLVRALSKNGGSFTVIAEHVKKTGKHNPDIEKVMASFEEGEMTPF